MAIKFKVVIVTLNLFFITVCELPQFTLDNMISLWCQQSSKLDTQERDIIKKFILQRVHLIERAEMNFIHPLRQIIYHGALDKFFQTHLYYYLLLRLPDFLNASLTHPVPQSIIQSDPLLQAYTKLLYFENHIQKPHHSSLQQLLNQAEDYYIERWYFLIECMDCM